MIKVESIHILELRGLRDLTLDFGDRNFVISGPNGSGKSGVVDAIEFCLTSEISRLSGKGTAGISLPRHGPHVNRRDDPSSAEVAMTVSFPALGQSAVITRNMKKPKELRIDPETPEIRSAVEEVQLHPEVVLSRREIIKYVLAEAGERSREVQALLRLDRIAQVRGALGTAHNKLKSAYERASQDAVGAAENLKRHLEIGSLSPDDILAAVNERRLLLGISLVESLTEHTQLDSGVGTGGQASTFNKQSALRDIDALKDSLERLPGIGTTESTLLVSEIGQIETDPSLLQLVQRESFIQTGLDFVDSALCPLCDFEWPDVEALRAHLREKLNLSASAGERRRRIVTASNKLAAEARRLRTLLIPVASLGESRLPEVTAEYMASWSGDLESFAERMGSLDAVVGAKDRLSKDWAGVPEGLLSKLDQLRSLVDAEPDQSAAVNAQTFLTRAQDRYSDYRRTRQSERVAKSAQDTAKVALDTYSQVAEQALADLYESVEEDFSRFYRELNSGDEVGFRAKLEQTAGKLDLSVDFYGRGMFPPAAYHSEGHQDGMGVCLYLALMKHLFGDQFSFAVLDDVVMSIDSGHRKQFCRLLRSEFPTTQFVITTHDAIWARQMRSEGLIESGAGVEFQGWSVETGPIFEPVSEVWDRIKSDLDKNDVPAAAARLRRHLEYTTAELADLLGASVPFRGDAAYDLGDLFSAVVGRHGELLRKGAASANSWNDGVAKTKVEGLQSAWRTALDTYGGEQWIVNKAVHYNEWADFSRADFDTVVKAIRALLQQLQCQACESWLYPSPKQETESYRCRCGAVSINLKKK